MKLNILNNAEIVVAVSENNVIGKDHKLIWHIKEDLQLFKQITNGHFIVMGRKTFESLPGVLPNRTHLILTRDKNYKVDNERVIVFHELMELIQFIQTKSDNKFYIIGGGEIYKLFLPIVQSLNVSLVHRTVEGDTFFPVISEEFKISNTIKYQEFTYLKYKIHD